MLLDEHVSAWNSPELEAAIHQKGRAASPREWARWLALGGYVAKTVRSSLSTKDTKNTKSIELLYLYWPLKHCKKVMVAIAMNSA